nr:hypothetical protein [Tanacetum cinerariifolium]
LDKVLSWLLVGGYQEVNAMLMRATAFLRLAIGLSEGRNNGTTNPKSIRGMMLEKVNEHHVFGKTDDEPLKND